MTTASTTTVPPARPVFSTLSIQPLSDSRIRYNRRTSYLYPYCRRIAGSVQQHVCSSSAVLVYGKRFQQKDKLNK